MIIAVDWDVKHQTKQTNLLAFIVLRQVWVSFSFELVHATFQNNCTFIKVYHTRGHIENNVG